MKIKMKQPRVKKFTRPQAIVFTISLLTSCVCLAYTPNDFPTLTVDVPATSDANATPLTAEAPAVPLAETKSDVSPVILSVSIAELQQMAILNHPDKKLAECLIESENATKQQAAIRPNPTLHYRGEEIGHDGSGGKQGMAISQEFLSAEKRRLQLLAIDKNVSVLDWKKQATLLAIHNDVRALAYQLLLAQYRVERLQEIYTITQSVEESARAAVNSGSGEISALKLIQLQNQTRQAKIKYTQQVYAKEAIEKKLLLLINRPTDRIGAITDNLFEVTRDAPQTEEEFLDDVLTNSPVLAMRRAVIAQRNAELAYERAPKRQFTVEGGVLYDFSSNQTIASAGLAVPLRVNDRNQGKIRSATADYLAAQRELESVELHLRELVAEYFAEYRAAQEEVVSYQREILPDMERYTRLCQNAYEHGELNMEEKTRAQVEYLEASLLYFDAYERLVNALVKLQGVCVDVTLGEK